MILHSSLDKITCISPVPWPSDREASYTDLPTSVRAPCEPELR